MAHKARGLHTAAGHGSHFGEGHAQRGHTGVLTAGDDHAHGDRLHAADTLEAAAGGHGVLEQRVQGDMLQSAVRVLKDGFVHVLVTAQVLVDAAVLGDDLAGALGVQLIGGLGIQPADGAAQAQTLRGDDAHVAGGEGLAHDAGVVHGYGLVGHGFQTVVTLGEHFVGMVPQLMVLLSIHHNLHLALIHDGLKFALDLGVEHFADVLKPEAGLKVGLGNPDTDHIALASVHDAFHAVQVGVELPLHDGLEVGLHVLAGDFHGVRQGDLGAHGDLVQLGAFHGDLVILNLGGFLGGNQLEAIHPGAVHFHLHVALADDLTLEGRGEGDGNVNLGDLDLDVPGLQGGGVELAHVFLDNEALGNPEDVLRLVGDDGEAQGNGAGAASHDHIVQRLEGVDKGRHTLHGVLHQVAGVAGGDVAEDQSSAESHGDHMDHRGHVTPERHHTDVVAGLIALFLKLVDDAAHQGHQDALALVALHQFHSLVSGGSGAQDDRHAGNVAGNQGHTQVPDEGVGHMAVAGSLVGRSAVQILQNLNELSAQGSGHAGHKGVVQPGGPGHEGLHHAQSGLQLAQGAHLHAGDGIVAGQGIGGVGEGHSLAFAILGNGAVDGGFSEAVYSVVAAEHSFK